jgi:hypothetical protein
MRASVKARSLKTKRELLKRDLSKQWGGIEPSSSLMVNSGSSKVAMASLSLVRESGEEDLVEEDGDSERWMTLPVLEAKPTRSDAGRAVEAMWRGEWMEEEGAVKS